MTIDPSRAAERRGLRAQSIDARPMKVFSPRRPLPIGLPLATKARSGAERHI
jgi:hypothetical protein